jgi:hypothetical protein
MTVMIMMMIVMMMMMMMMIVMMMMMIVMMMMMIVMMMQCPYVTECSAQSRYLFMRIKLVNSQYIELTDR